MMLPQDAPSDVPVEQWKLIRHGSGSDWHYIHRDGKQVFSACIGAREQETLEALVAAANRRFPSKRAILEAWFGEGDLTIYERGEQIRRVVNASLDRVSALFTAPGAGVEKEPERWYPWNDAERDWPEDKPHENGNYQDRCRSCGHWFTGHKRRVVCRKCVISSPPPENWCNDCQRYVYPKHNHDAGAVADDLNAALKPEER